MVTYIKLQFNDNVTIDLSTSSFLYKQSTFLQAFDLDEDTTLRSGASSSPITLDEGFASAGNVIYILCSSLYIINEYSNVYFDNKNDLSFMIALVPSKVINLCKFLDIIHYENEDKIFSKQFIEYVMSSSYMRKHIHEIQYFMQLEIKNVLNYINNIDIDIQIRTCTPEFYFLYLSEYKGHVIKYNRYDIYNAASKKNKYYSYIHKFNNQTTYQIKQEQEYIDYVIKISNQLLYYECDIINLKKRSKKQYPLKNNNINKIKKLINYGANINFQNSNGFTSLIVVSCQCSMFEVFKYLVDLGANIHLQDNYSNTALHYASYQRNLEVVKYLVDSGININLQNNKGQTALHDASDKSNNLEVIKYLVEHGANINLQDNNGQTALMIASHIPNNLEIVKYLIKHGANIHLLDNNGQSVLHYASDIRNNIEIVKYLIECGVNVNLQDNDGNTALHNACFTWFNVDIIQYLIEHGANIHLQNNHGDTILRRVNHVIYSDDVDDYLRQFI